LTEEILLMSVALRTIRYNPAASPVWNTIQTPGEAYYRFWHGGSYISQMPQIEVERWANAESVGGYFNRHVKGKY
jgi:KTSC domain